MSIDNENTEFVVVKNQQEQYSIWPTYQPIPDGWQAQDMKGKKSDCLEYINHHWTDMRPASLRNS